MAKKDIKLTQDLKFLQTKLVKMQAQGAVLIKEVTQMQNNLSTLNKQINTTQENIEKLSTNNDDLIFSEHSILRYIERVMGVDIEALKEKILPKEERQSILKTANSLSFKKDGVSFKIKDGIIITITKEIQN